MIWSRKSKLQGPNSEAGPSSSFSSISSRTRPSQSQGQSTFGTIRDDLNTLLKDQFRPNQTAENRFLPRGKARSLFREQKDLIEKLYRYGTPVSEQGADNASAFFRAVTASDVEDEDGVNGEDLALSNILALFVNFGVEPSSEEWRGLRNLAVKTASGNRSVCDRDLPLSQSDIERHFGSSRAEHLFELQFRFCPVILQKNRMLTLQQMHLLPILEEEQIGKGSSGTVYKVKIAQRHFRHPDLSENPEPIYLARKDLELNHNNLEHYKEEWNIVQWFVKNITKPRDVMITLASFQQGPNFSVFFQLAPLGNLWDYMQNDTRRSDDWNWKRHILRQTFMLSYGLDFLHNRLVDETTNEHVSCYHTDLKPSNILLVQDSPERPPSPENPPSDGPHYNLRFKITDFSISGMTRRKPSAEQPEPESLDMSAPFIRQLEHPRKMLSARDQSLTNHLGENSHCLAPEALPAGGRVKASTDVWAFGCVLSMVAAWIQGGWEGQLSIQDFSRRRAKQNKITFGFEADWFFTQLEGKGKAPLDRVHKNDLVAEIESMNGPTSEVLSINPAVQAWFDDAIQENQGKVEESVYKSIWDLLGCHILVANPERRYHIEQVLKDLKGIDLVSSINSSLASPQTLPREPSQEPPQALVPSPSSSQVQSQLLTLVSCTPLKKRKVVKTRLKVKLNSETGVSRCVASPNGVHCAFFSPRSISVVSLEEGFLRPGLTTSLSALEIPSRSHRSWGTFDLSNNYLCGVTGDANETIFELHKLGDKGGKIKSTAIARTDQGNCTSVVISQERTKDYITVAYTAEDASRSRAVFWFRLDDSLAQGTPTPDPRRLTLRDQLSGEVKDLRFSADGRYLSVVEQTSPSHQRSKVLIRIYTWDFQRDKECFAYETEPGESFRGSARTAYTSMIHLPNQPIFVIITQASVVKAFNFKSKMISPLAVPREHSNSRYLLLPHSSEEDTRLLLLGTLKAKNAVGVHEYISQNTAEHTKLTTVQTDTMSQFRPGADCAAIFVYPKRLLLMLCHCDGKEGKIEVLHSQEEHDIIHSRHRDE